MYNNNICIAPLGRNFRGAPLGTLGYFTTKTPVCTLLCTFY